MDQYDPHYYDKTPVSIEFEGTPDEFIQVCLSCSITNKNDFYPYEWVQTENKYCFSLKRRDYNIGNDPADVFASPLPKSRSSLTFRIINGEFDTYHAICQKLEDYLRSIGWIKPKNDLGQITEILPEKTKSAHHKNKSRIDVINRVAVALFALENREIPTYSSAAKRFKTHTETINRYANDPLIKKRLEEFRNDSDAYQRCKQMVSNEKRRK